MTPAVEVYWRAYRVLDQQRGFHQGGANPLGYEAIRRYAVDHGMVVDDAVTVLQMMDGEYFAIQSERLTAMRAQQERTKTR